MNIAANIMPIAVLFAIIVIGLLMRGGSRNGLGSLPVRPAPLMTKRERIVCSFIEQAIPQARVHAQVSMGAIVQPAKGLDRSRATSVRNRFSSQRVDYVLEDRASGRVIALIELDDRTHDIWADAQRDTMTGRAGYTTIRLPAIWHTQTSIREHLHETLGDYLRRKSSRRFSRNRHFEGMEGATL